MQRFALLGAGFIGTVHAQNLAAHPGVDFTVVYDVAVDKAAQVAAHHGIRVAPTLEAALDPDVVDAVFIATSTDKHAATLRQAVVAGLAVICEKPIDLEFARAAEVCRYAGRHAARVMMNFNRRFDPDHAELRRVVASGGVGLVELVHLTSRGPDVPPWKCLQVSGGQFRDQTVHFF
ncbi:MAG: Gfo/Idh/MocA family oxidoreductase [Propioniciclava sp.]